MTKRSRMTKNYWEEESKDKKQNYLFLFYTFAQHESKPIHQISKKKGREWAKQIKFEFECIFIYDIQEVTFPKFPKLQKFQIWKRVCTYENLPRIIISSWDANQIHSYRGNENLIKMNQRGSLRSRSSNLPASKVLKL